MSYIYSAGNKSPNYRSSDDDDDDDSSIQKAAEDKKQNIIFMINLKVCRLCE